MVRCSSPTMHFQALILVAEGYKQQHDFYPPNNIRLILSAAAHLPHSTAIELTKVFHKAQVYPTYGMSECMPIAIPLQGIDK